MRLSAASLALLALSPLAACHRDVPWRTPLAASVVGSPMQPGASLHLANVAAGAPVLASASLPPATYAADQAAQGRQVYETVCARCHPPDQLDGAQFSLGWKDRRMYDLYSLLTNTMPQDKPGTLAPEQYVDVIAYLLQRSHAAIGAALPADTGALKKMRIDVSAGGGTQ
jgi:mono/diheme cytochrome c family protein